MLVAIRRLRLLDVHHTVSGLIARVNRIIWGFPMIDPFAESLGTIDGGNVLASIFSDRTHRLFRLHIL